MSFEPRAIDPREFFAGYAFQLFADGARPTALSIPTLKNAIGAASEHAEGETDFGWALFERHVGGKEPSVTLLGEVEALEQSIVAGDAVVTPRRWLVSADGRGVETRILHEDTGWMTDSVRSRRGANAWKEGAYFAPSLQSLRVVQFVYFVAELAKQFPSVTRIEMGVAMEGLQGRSLNEAEIGTGFSVSRRSNVTGRTVVWTGTPEQLIGEGAIEAAASLIRPFAVLFDGFEVSAKRVEKYLSNRQRQ